MKPTMHTIESLMDLLPEGNRGICETILADNAELFKTVQGSSFNHQAWKGGYYDHVREVMNIGMILYQTLSKLRDLDFFLGDVLLVLFLHDIEKPWKYELLPDHTVRIKSELKTKAAQREFRERKVREYGIHLTLEQEIALKYVEGEGDDYSPTERAMNELGALCHMADIASARLWHNHPLEENDPWEGAVRINNASE